MLVNNHRQQNEEDVGYFALYSHNPKININRRNKYFHDSSKQNIGNNAKLSRRLIYDYENTKVMNEKPNNHRKGLSLYKQRTQLC